MKSVKLKPYKKKLIGTKMKIWVQVFSCFPKQKVFNLYEIQEKVIGFSQSVEVYIVPWLEKKLQSK